MEDPIKLRTTRIKQDAAMKKMIIAAKKVEKTVSMAESSLG